MDKKPFCQSQAMEYIAYLCILAERNDTDRILRVLKQVIKDLERKCV